MKRWIHASTTPNKLSAAIAELKNYATLPTMKFYVEFRIKDMLKYPDIYDESRIADELKKAEICYNASEQICDITGILPDVDPSYTLAVPTLTKTTFLRDWMDSLNSKDNDAHIDSLVSKWVSKYQKVLKTWYNWSTERDPNLADPSVYADYVLDECAGIIFDASVVDNRDVAEKFIEKTMLPTYRRRRGKI